MQTKRRVLLISFLVGIGGAIASFTPVQAFADSTSSQTTQILPQVGSSCVQLPVLGMTPYLYNDALHSFDIVVPDSSYVAIIASVGNTSIPFNQISRSIQGGALRVHVDIDTTPVYGTLPLTVTLLSAKGAGQPVCMTVVRTSVTSTVTAPATPSNPIPVQTPSGSTSGSGSNTVTKKPIATSTASSTGSLAKTALSPVTGSIINSLKDTCGSASSASRMWFILLVLYALVAGLAATGHLQATISSWKEEWASIAIVVPFLLLFGIWYVLESCRTGIWAPAIAIIIALAGLAGVYWNRRSDIVVIPLPAEKPKTVAQISPKTQTQLQIQQKQVPAQTKKA